MATFDLMRVFFEGIHYGHTKNNRFKPGHKDKSVYYSQLNQVIQFAQIFLINSLYIN